jgi:hypothetical protein
MDFRAILEKGDVIEVNSILRESINNKTMQDVLINILITFNQNIKDDVIIKVSNFFNLKSRLNLIQKKNFCKQICLLDRYVIFDYLYDKELDTSIHNSNFEGFSDDIKQTYNNFVLKRKIEIYNKI